ncbi:MerR family transcriptional regulator [Pseudonocardia acaciae]|uniref:MerR family transcriptional regulator n=1 Tax=Pseudonocardia acaciae TaxID=551276 RepID=UPI00048F1BC1|nr:MerR family transcriptional regulator [Pseudonocardia acaciae]
MEKLFTITDVAARFDLPRSTLHYWERRGLLGEPHRRSGRRCYDTDQLYRIALIKLWRTTGLLAIDDIALILTGESQARDWRDTITSKLADIENHMAQLDTARSYLSHLLDCPLENTLEQCPNFRATVEHYLTPAYDPLK